MLGDLDRLLPRGERARSRASVHPIGLIRLLGGRVLQLAAVLLVKRAFGSQWLAEATRATWAVDLGVAPWLEPIPGQLVRGAMLIAGIVLVAACLDAINWRLGSFLLSEQRVLHGYGILTRITVDIPLDRITSTALRQGPLARYFDYGDLLLRTSTEPSGHPLPSVRSVTTFRRELEKQRQAVVSQRSPAAAVEARRAREIRTSIEDLAELRSEGLITAEEFEAKKSGLLHRI